jgi:hypothetical protein
MVGLEFELRTSHLQSRHTLAWARAMPQIHFALDILETGVLVSLTISPQGGRELRSSQSLPPKKLGLQAIATMPGWSSTFQRKQILF